MYQCFALYREKCKNNYFCKVKLAWLIPDWEQEIRGCLVEETRHSLYRVRANTQIS